MSHFDSSFEDDDFGVFDGNRLIRGELSKGESLLWSGRPNPSRALWMTLPVVLFGIPWTAFSLLWEGIALWMTFFAGGPAGGPPVVFKILFPLFGLPFVLIGLGMLSSPYWLARRMKRAIYGVTDQRAIIMEPTFMGGSVTVVSVLPGDMTSMTKVVRGDGSGDLILSEAVIRTNRARTVPRRQGFFGIPNVTEVERLIRSRLTSNDGAGFRSE